MSEDDNNVAWMLMPHTTRFFPLGVLCILDIIWAVVPVSLLFIVAWSEPKTPAAKQAYEL